MKSNEHLRRDVSESLKWEPLLHEAEIGVNAEGGVITLTGHVDSYAKKLAAERAAKSVNGVRGLAEEIEVRLSTANRLSDTEIAEAAVNALKWASSIPDKRITLSVENGWVKLEGDVEWQYQKDEARIEIEGIAGVIGITNLIEVQPEINPSDIKDKIQRAFERTATIDSSNVKIEVDGSFVTLKGTVSSWAELEDAENVAWSAPGVSKVNVEITVAEEEPIK
jgi:osmotically-inducible protein OsmY